MGMYANKIVGGNKILSGVVHQLCLFEVTLTLLK